MSAAGGRVDRSRHDSMRGWPEHRSGLTTLLNGRLASLSIGISSRKAGKTAIPVVVQTLDPLKHIDKLALDWWLGDPEQPRLASARRPGTRAGDLGKRRRAPVNYRREAAFGHAELLLEEMPPSNKVLWLQPICSPPAQ